MQTDEQVSYHKIKTTNYYKNCFSRQDPKQGILSQYFRFLREFLYPSVLITQDMQDLSVQ